MKTKWFIFGLVSLSLTLNTSKAQILTNSNTTPMTLNSFETIRLEQPDLRGGDPLMQTLSHRKSDRDFQTENLSLKHLSEILWAAYGRNREDGKRTAPSALALYPLQLYAILANGIYRYDAQAHELVPVVEGDHRALAGGFPAARTAPVNLVFIADYDRYRNTGNEMIDGFLSDPQIRVRFASLDAGHCTQNVYLYCASEGIKTGVRGCVAGPLMRLLGLGGIHEFIVAQT
ncbi:MAG: SagB/ThcOx family dehydrogenase, partial [Rikenellaceae bacterium]|nr:SagB/ThcOx family dehydrogenase [Rikenellaceae bacterium]